MLTNYLPPGAPSSLLGTWLATYYINAGSAWISGVELQYVQHWSNLPGFLGGFGMNVNYSYIGSQTSGIAGRSDKPRLLENAPNLFNIGPTYNRGPFAMQMNINFNQSSIYYYQYTDGAPGGPTGPLGDNYNYDHTQIDAQGSYAIRPASRWSFPDLTSTTKSSASTTAARNTTRNASSTTQPTCSALSGHPRRNGDSDG